MIGALETFTQKEPSVTFSPGNTVLSPGGSFIYHIHSYPFSRLFWDIKGGFDKLSAKKVAAENLPDEYMFFFYPYRAAGFYYVPNFERMVSTLLSILLLSMALKNSYQWWNFYFSNTSIAIPFKDNSPWIQDERGKWVKGEYPCTYWVTVEGFESKPFLHTFRVLPR